MAGVLFQGNSLVADTASLIYLAKSSLIYPFLRAFHVSILPLVSQECVHKAYRGSKEIEELHLTPRIGRCSARSRRFHGEQIRSRVRRPMN